jgi:hypothetical protein
VPARLARSGPSAPVFDAVMVGGEAVANAPQNGLGAAGDVDLAIERSDVGHAWLDTDATAAPAAPQRRSVKWR